uniref:Centromere-associated protein E-like n=1 Tax=Phallusia mammillata TaxID=59560 RepID=A0A6F9D9J4_9ASCI|nr:centromere-associated protein E-like [Phallusia mammillata]
MLYQDAGERSMKQKKEMDVLLGAKEKEICEMKDKKHSLEQDLNKLQVVQSDSEKLQKGLNEATDQIVLLQKELEKQQLLYKDAEERSEKQINDLNALMEAKAKEICESKDEKHNLEQNLHQLKADNEKLYKSLTEVTEQITLLEKEVEKQKMLCQDAGERSEKEIKELDALLQAKEKEICEMKDEKHNLEQDPHQLQISQTDDETLQEKFTEASDKITFLQNELERQKLLYQDAEEKSEKQKKELDALIIAKEKEMFEVQDGKHSLKHELHQLQASQPDSDKLIESLHEANNQTSFLQNELERSEKQKVELEALLEAKEKEICETKGNLEVVQSELQSLQRIDHEEDGYQQQLCAAAKQIETLRCELQELQMSMNARKEEQMRLLEGQEHLDEAQQNFVRLYHEFTQLTDTLEEVKIQNQELTNSLKEQQLKLEESEKCKNAFQVDVESLNEKLAENLEQIDINQQKLDEECKNNQFLSENLLALQSENKDLCVTLENMKNEFANLKASLVDGNTEKHVCSTSEETQNDNAFNEKVEELGKMQDLILELKGKLSESDEAKETMTLKLSTLQTENLQLHDEIEKMVNLKTEPETKNEAFNCISEGIQQSSPSPDHDSLKQEMENLEIQNRELKSHLESVVPLSAVKLLHESLAELKTENEELKILVLDQKDQMHSKCAQLQDGVKIFAEQFENQQKTILKDEDVKIEMNVYKDMNTQYMDLKLKYDTKLDELQANVAKTEELQMTISTMEAQILSSEDIIKSLQAQLSAANEEISYSTELKSTISTFQEKITNNEEIIDSLQKELRAANEQTRIISEEAAISNTKSEQDLSNLQTEVSELKSKIETLAEQHATSLDELTERNAMLQTEVEHTIQTKETLAQENEAKSTLAEELSESLTTLKKQVEGFEAELKKSEEQLKTQSASSEKEIQYLNEVLASEKKLLDEKNIELENTANLLKEALEKMDKIETNEPASIHGGEDDHKACKSKILDLQDLLDVSDLDLRRSRSDQEHLAQLLKEHENEIKDLQMAKDDSEAQLKDAASIKDLLLKKEAELSDFILDKSQLEENVKSLKSEIDLLNSELKTESAEKLDLEVQVQDLKRCISEDKTPLIEALNAQKDLSETEKNFFVLYQEFTALTEKCSTLESAVISSKDDEEKLKTTITQQETQLNELKHDLEVMTQQKIELETAKSCHDDEKLDLEKLQTELQALRESCHTADSNLKIESEKVARLEEECRVKEEAVSTLEEKMQTEIITLNKKISCHEVEIKQKEERLCVMQSELNQLEQDNAEIACVKLTLEKNIVKLKEQHSFDLKQKEEVSLKLCEELEEMKSQVSHSAHVEQLQNEVQCLKEKMESDLDKADTEKKQLVDCIEQLKAVISEKETKVEQFDRRLELQKSEFLLEIDEANKASKRETNHFIEMANLKEEKLQIEFQHNSQELLKCQNNLEAKTCECISLNEKITEIEETLKKKDILLSKMQESDITKQKDDESKQKFKDLQVKYNKLNLEYLQVCKEVDQFEAETAKLKQQVHTHANMEDLLKKSQELDQLQTEYKELEQKIQSLERKYAKRHLDYLEVCKEVDNLETENEKFKTMGRHTRSKSSESEPAKDLEEALAENTVLHRKFTKWRTDYMEVCKEVDQLEAENDGFKKSQKQDQAELKKLQLEVKTLNELMPLLPASQIRLINQREVDLETKQEKIQELEKSVKRQSVAIEENDKLKIAIQSRDMDIKILKGKIQQLQKSLAQLKTVQPKQRKESENLLEETQLNQQQQVTATGGQPTRRVTRSAVLPGGIVQRTKLDLQEKEMNILRNKMEHLEKELAKYKAIEVTRRGENQNLLDKNKSLRSYLSKLQHEHGKRSSQNSVISGLDVAIQTDNGTPTDQTDESPAQCKNQ